ncbi:hypothetical protein GCM10011514_18570 [Emticicia aquatilis]|uniref:DUF4595 domain-containing protein n=1 Tax=Emticicia aquatilis TaxID=1537369 RepID=A0A917DNS6_9BACT|nr:hypothetical protein [Emticicia aquatilis]GGD54687.1 hypothetical protein GCM10011514_18570 [Emticicia aquatilis]
MKTLPILLLPALFFACSTKDTPNAQDAIEKQILADIDAKPSILAKPVSQKLVSKVEVNVQYDKGPNLDYVYNYEYDLNGKIKAIKSNLKDIWTFSYQGNELIVSNGSGLINKKYTLDKSGLAQMDNFYYKDGYLWLSIGKEGFANTYSTEGNLIARRADGIKADYEYTEFPNTIRQEVVSPSSISLYAITRDNYLGNFSTNLLKRVQFSEGENVTLDYSYKFDAENRVKTMTIRRKSNMNGMGDATFQCVFSY